MSTVAIKDKRRIKCDFQHSLVPYVNNSFHFETGDVLDVKSLVEYDCES